MWTSPTIDRQKGVLYIGTGNSYTGPAVKTSDAVIAMDLEDRQDRLVEPGDAGDAFLVGCRPGLENCPKELGPDHDFGNAPILRTLPGGKRIIVIGQKSGIVWGLDPDNEGKVLWQFKAGKGGALGGIEWGSAADDTAAYIPVSDVLTPPNEAGGLFALKLTDGQPLWHTPAPKLECNTGRGCTGAQSAPVSVIPGVVFSGSVDGHMRAYSTTDGIDPLGLQHRPRVRDGEPRARQGRIDRRRRPGDRRRTARHQLGLRAVARAAGERAAGVFGEMIR